ncbi:hypothetical protein F3Y22_tig00110782pilonHSYRG00037 [Hibiscus syriacus]|uniref:Uncharacterized protein n=1 Tax=Hibiscus syriacus TaxID=106335 RepID=A0A6A2ZRD7_HIBSY|nr:hypothetical protein F3Y22_tig00110782pilonHSYRG00037 [Hibiscus syriacus]
MRESRPGQPPLPGSDHRCRPPSQSEKIYESTFDFCCFRRRLGFSDDRDPVAFIATTGDGFRPVPMRLLRVDRRQHLVGSPGSGVSAMSGGCGFWKLEAAAGARMSSSHYELYLAMLIHQMMNLNKRLNKLFSL